MTLWTNQEVSSGAQSTSAPKKPLQVMFKEARDATPKSLANDSWYLIVAATLLSTDGGSHFGDLFQYILQAQGNDSTPESRKRVSRQLREVLGKGWTLTGIPRACDAHFSLSKVEGEDADLTTSDREKIVEGSNGKEVALARTDKWFENVFTGADHTRIWASTETNVDLTFTIKYTVYGLYLSDLGVFNPLENELVMVSCVLSQGGRVASLSHLKGLRMLGVNASDADGVQKVIEMVARWMGKDVSGWVQAKEVAHFFE